MFLKRKRDGKLFEVDYIGVKDRHYLTDGNFFTGENVKENFELVEGEDETGMDIGGAPDDEGGHGEDDKGRLGSTKALAGDGRRFVAGRVLCGRVRRSGG